MIKMDVELDCLQLKGARDFYNDVVSILYKFEVTKFNRELCMLIACKNHEALYARLILGELRLSKPDFDRLCNHVLEIQRLTKSGNKGCRNNKEVILSPVDGTGAFSGKCYNCGKACGYQAKECRKPKGDLNGRCTGESEGGNTGNSSFNKTCNFCGVKGHKESQCFNKNLRRHQHGEKQRTTKWSL